MEKQKTGGIRFSFPESFRKRIPAESKKEAFFALLPWVCLIGAYLAAVLFQLIYGKQLVNSDMSAEMLLADELNRSGEFVLSKNWYYSTELRVLNQQLTLQLGLLLFPANWHLARTFSMAILLAMHALCFLFLMHECGLKRIGVYCTAILMCPFGFWYMWYGTWGTFYLPHIMMVSLNLALALHIARKGKHSGLCMILFLPLSLVEGLGGVRMLMVFYVPMAAAVLVIAFLRVQKAPLEKPLRTNPELRLAGVAFLTAASSGVGYLINTNVFAGNYVFETYGEQYWMEFNMYWLINICSMFLRLFGWPYHENWTSGIPWEENYLFSASGILGAFGLLFMAAVVFSAVRLLTRLKTLSFAHLTVVITFWVCLAVECIVYAYLQEDGMNSSYFLPMVSLTVAMIGVEISTENFRIPALRSLAVAGLLFCVVCSSCSTVLRFLQLPPRVREGLETVGEWLAENGYTQGYASFWNGDVLTELTNGQVEVWVVEDVWSMKIYQWLQPVSHDNPPEGKIFVLLDPRDGEADQSLPYYQEEYVIYTDDNDYVVLGFDSAEQLYELMAAAE